MKIAFGDLKLDKRTEKHLEDAVSTNRISGGPKVKILEDTWGNLFNYKYNIAMSSGTSADMAACMSLYDFGAKRGDEIIAPALAFAAVGNSIVASGFTPAFIDVKRDTMNIDSDKIENKITHKTRAIMAVHTMGKPCDMQTINWLAKT